MSKLAAFEVYRVEAPLGRTIGDNSCAYDRLLVVALCLRCANGREGWGYAEVQALGHFTRGAPWIRQLPGPAALSSLFADTWWARLKDREITETELLRKSYRSPEPALDSAVSLALWDLAAQQAGMPLYRFLGGPQARAFCKTYGSPLDFPLTDADTVALIERFLSCGISHIKIKVGAQSGQRDIDRLQLAASVVGRSAILSADANEAWDWETAVERIREYALAGIDLEYIEDPLHRHDASGLRELVFRSPIPVAGHDYLTSIDEVASLVDAGLGAIRTNGNIDYMLECVALAERKGLPVYVGNSFAEVLVHVACAFPVVDRIEFSGLALSDLITRPIAIHDGAAYAPEVPGHGLILKDEFRDAAIR